MASIAMRNYVIHTQPQEYQAFNMFDEHTLLHDDNDDSLTQSLRESLGTFSSFFTTSMLVCLFHSNYQNHIFFPSLLQLLYPAFIELLKINIC